MACATPANPHASIERGWTRSVTGAQPGFRLDFGCSRRARWPRTRIKNRVGPSGEAAIPEMGGNGSLRYVASVLKGAGLARRFGITGRRARDRLRKLVSEADRARDDKDWHQASRLYRQVLELDPALHAVRVQLGHAYKELGDLTNAGRCYEAALQLAPTDDDLYLQVGH